MWIAGRMCWSNQKRLGRLYAFGAASATVTDRVPKTLWQVHSPIHSSSQTFDSLGNKTAVLPSDDKNQITSEGTERLIGLFFFLQFLAIISYLYVFFISHSVSIWGKKAMIEAISCRERKVQEGPFMFSLDFHASFPSVTHFLKHMFIYILLENILTFF